MPINYNKLNFIGGIMFSLIGLIAFCCFIFPNLVSADMGPKPTADIQVTLNNQQVPDANFAAKMLVCHYQMKYEQIIAELEPYEKTSDWFDKCEEIAPKYNFDKETCVKELQNQRGMTNLAEEARCNHNLMCEKLIQKIPDTARGCYWTIAQLAWGGNCQNFNCHFNYFLPDEFRLTVYLPSQDKIYLSERVTRNNFNSTYEADLLSNGTINLRETTPVSNLGPLKVTRANPISQTKNISFFLIALILTIIFEFIIALIYISLKRIPGKILISIVLANIISLPIVWFVFPLLNLYTAVIIFGEIFAFIFEAYFIYFLNKKIISLKNSFILSLLMNLVSLFFGGIILFLLTWFGFYFL